MSLTETAASAAADREAFVRRKLARGALIRAALAETLARRALENARSEERTRRIKAGTLTGDMYVEDEDTVFAARKAYRDAQRASDVAAARWLAETREQGEGT